MPSIFPILRCLPERVNGIPVFLEIFCFNHVKPIARFHENVKPGPSFIVIAPSSLFVNPTLHESQSLERTFNLNIKWNGVDALLVLLPFSPRGTNGEQFCSNITSVVNGECIQRHLEYKEQFHSLGKFWRRRKTWLQHVVDCDCQECSICERRSAAPILVWLPLLLVPTAWFLPTCCDTADYR